MESQPVREWLETDGKGGFACGSVGGELTRFWHGLLWVATRPPTARVKLVSGVQERIDTGAGQPLYLSSSLGPTGRWSLPDLRPSFSAHPMANWSWRLLSGATIERCVFMPQGPGGTVILRYEYHRPMRGAGAAAPSAPVRLLLRLLLPFEPAQVWPANGILVPQGRQPVDGAAALPLYVQSSCALVPTGERAHGPVMALHRTELDCEEDPVAAIYQSPEVGLYLTPGKPEWVVMGAAPLPAERRPEQLFRHELTRRACLRGPAPHGDIRSEAEGLGRRLARAADAFIVERHDGRHTIMAGYPWFTDWGRDTMIALPGLCLETGRLAEARSIIEHFLAHLDQGVIPNLFPEEGTAPQFNTIDATLWLFEAVFRYGLKHDPVFLRTQMPRLLDIIDWHVRGTHNDIRLEPDGLLRGGSKGSQLTWMDVKINGHVPTPRHGKPVEIQALWYNALRLMVENRGMVGLPAARASELDSMAQAAATSFAARFVMPGCDSLADVVDRDGEGTCDPAIRPNMVIPFALRHNIIPREIRPAVLRAAARHLLTPRGLRSLAPGQPGYVGIYRGDREKRDHAYHQGTVWMWLIGPYVKGVETEAARVPELAAALPGLRRELLHHFESEGCLESASEIADAESPHQPRGCFAQAWSVAALIEVLGLPGAAREGVQA